MSEKGPIIPLRFVAGSVVRQKSTSILMTVLCGAGQKTHCGWFTNTRLHEALIPGEDLEIIAVPGPKMKEED